MVQEEHRGAGRWSRLRSRVARWCLASAVSGIAASVSLFNAAFAVQWYPWSLCQRGKPSCSSCPQNPGPNTEACAQYLSGWHWGLCSDTFLTISCSETARRCGALLNCQANEQVGICEPNGFFRVCK
jgi:hypothetical protein